MKVRDEAGFVGGFEALPFRFLVFVAGTLLLVNAWGLARSAGSPWWIGSNHSGVSEVYNGLGVKQALVVTIPGDGSVTEVQDKYAIITFTGKAAAKDTVRRQ